MSVEVFLSQKLGRGKTRPELKKKGGIWKTCEQLQPCFMKRHLSSIRTGRWRQFSKDPPPPGSKGAGDYVKGPMRILQVTGCGLRLPPRGHPEGAAGGWQCRGWLEVCAPGKGTVPCSSEALEGGWDCRFSVTCVLPETSAQGLRLLLSGSFPLWLDSLLMWLFKLFYWGGGAEREGGRKQKYIRATSHWFHLGLLVLSH
ncbi:hypothetical protein HJG60_009517 [Phyllostomus discolor]|uniref:Uncharacterized protein n=1 Tax=Phyllostomus discolor TaxID=89673 RepID=A0A833YG95_9CHIR|nr:hypothetical protein HJG60_009517 [Phyllostomus discolor]